jgi:hypothetical protein
VRALVDIRTNWDSRGGTKFLRITTRHRILRTPEQPWNLSRDVRSTIGCRHHGGLERRASYIKIPDGNFLGPYEVIAGTRDGPNPSNVCPISTSDSIVMRALGDTGAIRARVGADGEDPAY